MRAPVFGSGRVDEACCADPGCPPRHRRSTRRPAAARCRRRRRCSSPARAASGGKRYSTWPRRRRGRGRARRRRRTRTVTCDAARCASSRSRARRRTTRTAVSARRERHDTRDERRWRDVRGERAVTRKGRARTCARQARTPGRTGAARRAGRMNPPADLLRTACSNERRRTSVRSVRRPRGEDRHDQTEHADEVATLTRFRRSLTTRDWRSLAGCSGSSCCCTSSASASCSAWSIPQHFQLGGDHPVFTVGVGILAYTFGLRHAFDADHIAAVDNTTRKLMADNDDRRRRACRGRDPQAALGRLLVLASATRRSCSRWPSCSPSA